MGKMILCRGRQTDKPLVIEGTGMRLKNFATTFIIIYTLLVRISLTADL